MTGPRKVKGRVMHCDTPAAFEESLRERRRAFADMGRPDLWPLFKAWVTANYEGRTGETEMRAYLSAKYGRESLVDA